MSEIQEMLCRVGFIQEVVFHFVEDDCEFDEADNHEEQWAASSDAVIKWEEIDEKRRESGDESRA